MSPQELVSPFSSTTAPWWLQPLYFFGIPAGIACFLVWFLTTVVVAGQGKTQDTLDAHVAEQNLHFAIEQRLLSQICRNTSQTEREASMCQVPR